MNKKKLLGLCALSGLGLHGALFLLLFKPSVGTLEPIVLSEPVQEVTPDPSTILAELLPVYLPAEINISPICPALEPSFHLISLPQPEPLPQKEGNYLDLNTPLSSPSCEIVIDHEASLAISEEPLERRASLSKEDLLLPAVQATPVGQDPDLRSLEPTVQTLPELKNPALSTLAPFAYPSTNIEGGWLNLNAFARAKREFNPPLNPAHHFSQPPEQWDSRDPLCFYTLPGFESYGIPESALQFPEKEPMTSSLALKRRWEEGQTFFSASITPHFDLSNEQLPHTLLFLIDRTDKIENTRFQTYKTAVIKAMKALPEGQQFNIYILDDQITKMSRFPFSASKESIAIATTFLEKAKPSLLFTNKNLHTTLYSILCDAMSKEEMTTAFLLSDGDTLRSGFQKKNCPLRDKMQENPRRFSLYTATAAKGNDLTLLKLMASLNRGEFLYSDTYAGLPRKFAKLVHSALEPIAHSVEMHVIPSDPDVQVFLFRSPAILHNDSTYTCSGVMDRPCDFTLLLQGWHKGVSISISKKFDIQTADQNSPIALESWRKEQEEALYERFFNEGSLEYLREAKKIENSKLR